MFEKLERKFWLAQKKPTKKKSKRFIPVPPSSPATDSTSIEPQPSDQPDSFISD
jgi:hypothetical protein